MPYLKKDDKSRYDAEIEALVSILDTETRGCELPQCACHLHYVIGSFFDQVVEKRFARIRYSICAMVSGTMVNIRSEFYDRVVSPKCIVSPGRMIKSLAVLHAGIIKTAPSTYQKTLDALVEKICEVTMSLKMSDCAGHLNYVVSRLIIRFIAVRFKKVWSDIRCLVMDVMTGVYTDFYNNTMRPYEDIKIEENGDVGYEDIL